LKKFFEELEVKVNQSVNLHKQQCIQWHLKQATETANVKGALNPNFLNLTKNREKFGL